MTQLDIPPGVKWELLVVNNNSTDDTYAVALRYADRLPIYVMSEVKQGQSNARNRAVAAAKGDVIIWTDDDVLVEQSWLAEYASAVKRHPEADYFGGPIRPWFPVNPPRWLGEQYRACGWPWAVLDLGGEERHLNRGEWVYGANMAFRSETQRQYPFDPTLGHVANRLGGGDDIGLQKQIRQFGGVGVWLPKAVVRHYVVPERMTLKYAWKRGCDSGRNDFFTGEFGAASSSRRIPRWMLRKYATCYARYLYKRLTGGKDWLASYVHAARLRGAIAAAREGRGLK